MRRLLMSRLIRIFTVCLVDLFFIPIIKIWNKQGRCLNLADRPNLPELYPIWDSFSYIMQNISQYKRFSTYRMGYSSQVQPINA